MTNHSPTIISLALCILFLSILAFTDSLSKSVDRRHVLSVGTAAGAAWQVMAPSSSAASSENVDDTTIDWDKITAARAKSSSVVQSVVSLKDPPPLLTIRGKSDSSSIQIPRVGYSFYKTPPEQAARCTALALLAGVRHLDIASQYGSTAEIAQPLQQYLDMGISGVLKLSRDEKPELIELLQATSAASDKHAREMGATSGLVSLMTPPPEGSVGRRGRRNELFLHYKLANEEQSEDATSVQRAVKNAIDQLKCGYFDMVSIHSPLTTPRKRLATYAALLELQSFGFCKSVGVCNYGLGPLKEIANVGLILPALNQLELSPFNTHQEVVDWCSQMGVAVGCSAWSRLSSTQAIQDKWLDVVGGIAQGKGVTKAQVLIRWALQKGYASVPRSAAATKVERVAIAENSYGGVSSFQLDKEEMTMLDGLNVSLKAGALGRRDGWSDSDVQGADWDPTDIV